MKSLGHIFCKLSCLVALANALLCEPPHHRSNEPLQVNLTLELYHMEHFDDVAGTVTIMASLSVRWRDLCVSEKVKRQAPPNRASGPYYVDQENLWKPLLIHANSKDSPAIYENPAIFPVHIYEDDVIEWWIFKTWESNCHCLQMKNFPLDEHQCNLSFSAWEESFIKLSAVELEQRNTGTPQSQLWTFSLDQPRLNSAEFACRKIKCRETWADFPIILRRKWYPYYFYGIFVPLLSLVFLQLSAFIIPYNCIDRTAFSVTLFVALTVTRSDLQKYIPETSESIIVVVAANIGLIASMVATIYFTLIFRLWKEDKYYTDHLEKVDLIMFILFILFYTILCSVAIVCISN